MTRLGVGARFTVLTVCLLFVLTGVRPIRPAVFRVESVSYHVLVVLAPVLIAIGVPFYVSGVLAVMKAFNEGRLCTTGVFGCCRHPGYASWVGALYRQEDRACQ
jgi:protein-S-isoprenylcysteine O-methyltransferase Ste14